MEANVEALSENLDGILLRAKLMATITPAGDCAIVISFGETFSETIHLQVRALVNALRHHTKLPLRDIQPAYTSVLVRYDPLKVSMAALTRSLRPLMKKAQSTQSITLEPRHVEIPVCYDTPLAPDLEAVAASARLSTEEVIRLHTSAEY